MLILEPETKTRQPLNLKKPLLYSSIFLFAAILIAPAIYSFTYLNQPTGTYLDPRPQNSVAQATPTNIPVSPEQLILSAQAYLEKAVTLSHKTDQTDIDKQQIVSLLNQSLEYSNQAVVSAPNAPQSYLVRARVLASSSSIRPDAIQLAQKDLEIAQKLSGGQSVELPTQVNLLNLSPTQQASLAQNVIIAAPNESSPAADTTGQTSSNVIKDQIVLKKDQTEVTINHPAITADTYLYIVNTSGNSAPIYIKSKDVGKAIIASLQPVPSDTTVEYWLIKP